MLILLQLFLEANSRTLKNKHAYLEYIFLSSQQNLFLIQLMESL